MNDTTDGYRTDYWKLSEMVAGFNGIQARTRQMASAWMLAAFSGVAVLLRQSPENTWLVSPFVLVFVVCILAIVGLVVLWMIDQFVYQRLLNAAFLAALKLESDHAELPAVRTMMLKGSGGMSKYLRVYYFAPIAVFLVTAILAATFHRAGGGLPALLTVQATARLMVLVTVAASAMVLWILTLSRKVGTRSLVRELEHPRLETISGDAGVTDTLDRWVRRNTSHGPGTSPE